MPARPSVTERREQGRSARERAPIVAHGEWSPAPDRRDPMSILEDEATDRVPDLLPIRYGRMVSSAFAFYRGAAAIMAADLATAPRSGLEVQLCGDAHLSNFGGFASPERAFVFDINDFDETLPGPFEWDVKRLAASLEIAGRSLDFDETERRAIVLGGVKSYGRAMAEFAGLHNIQIWYSRLDVDDVIGRWGSEMGTKVVKNLRRSVDKASTKDRMKALGKLTEMVDGERLFKSDPPLLVPVEEVFADVESDATEKMISDALLSYRSTLQTDRRRLVETYHYAHLARKVVGVGSVGTRSWVVLLLGRDASDPLFLQVKEAEASVLEPFLGKSRFHNHGRRVVEGQRVMQAASDNFLGWQRVDSPDGRTRDFYVRQLWDWKASFVVENMNADVLRIYGEICGWVLARAHARSGDAVAIDGYLGKNRAFSSAVLEFSGRYADQNEHDHAALVAAIDTGRFPATAGA